MFQNIEKQKNKSTNFLDFLSFFMKDPPCYYRVAVNCDPKSPIKIQKGKKAPKKKVEKKHVNLFYIFSIDLKKANLHLAFSLYN